MKRRPAWLLLAFGSASLLSAAPGAAEELLPSTRFPMVVHHEPSDLAFASAVLAAAEAAWAFQVLERGMRAPPADAGAFGSDDYDIFVQASPYLAYVEPLVPASDRTNGSTSRMVVDRTLPEFALPLVVSHELHHAIQLGVCPFDANFAESGAVYVSGTQLPDDATFLSYFIGFNEFQSTPYRSVDWTGALLNGYEYGSALVWIYLDDATGAPPLEHYTALLQRLGEAPAGGCPHYLDALGETVDVDAAYGEFARWRYFVGPEDDGQHFAALSMWEASQPDQKLQSVMLSADLDLSALPVEAAAPEEPPMRYGATYVRVGLAGIGPDEHIELRFQGDAAVRWSVGVVRVELGPTGEEEMAVPEDGQLETQIVSDGASHLVLVFSNLGDGTHDGSGADWEQNAFTYSLALGAPSPEPPSEEEPQPEEPIGEPPPRTSSEGCACAVPIAAGTPPMGTLAMLSLAIAVARRRRSRR
jgi:MYXO-CTERM domain-containing protein